MATKLGSAAIFVSANAAPPGNAAVAKKSARRPRLATREGIELGAARNKLLPSGIGDVLTGPDPSIPFLHDPAEIPTDLAYAARSATGRWRTTPLRALWQHPPYFHDGSAPDLRAVVDWYNSRFSLGLTDRQKADLVEFLKTL